MTYTLEHLRALESRATRGPWRNIYDGYGAMVLDPNKDEVCGLDLQDISGEQQDRNAQFIAAARTALPELIAEIERLQARVEALCAVAIEAQDYLDALDTCHVCGGKLHLEDREPTHCEDCSAHCEDHEEPECDSIFVQHNRVRNALRAAFPGQQKSEVFNDR